VKCMTRYSTWSNKKIEEAFSEILDEVEQRDTFRVTYIKDAATRLTQILTNDTDDRVISELAMLYLKYLLWKGKAKNLSSESKSLYIKTERNMEKIIKHFNLIPSYAPIMVDKKGRKPKGNKDDEFYHKDFLPEEYLRQYNVRKKQFIDRELLDSRDIEDLEDALKNIRNDKDGTYGKMIDAIDKKIEKLLES